MAYDRGSKYVTVKKLRELLALIPDDLEIECNQVGNLSIFAGPGQWRGFINLNTEEVIWDDDGRAQASQS